MPAKNLYRVDEEGTYSHVYNKGVEKRIIFNDEEDYEVFLGYLKDYLTAPKDPESIKKVFTVHGRTFRGTPHRPKNYVNKVELIAYSVMPDRFHLLLHQIAKNSLEGFIRSLCTRYSMYFNKKYQRIGALFDGPYKSVPIMDKPRLLYLTRYLHRTGSYSSCAEYLGLRETSWIKPKVVLDFLDNGTDGDKGKAFAGSAYSQKRAYEYSQKTSGYKDFMEKHEFDQKEEELIEGITFKSETQHLERRDPARHVASYPPEIPTVAPEKMHPGPNVKHRQRIPEFLVTVVVFLLLLTLGVRNIMGSTTKRPIPAPTPEVLSTTKAIEEIKPSIVTVTIGNSAKNINIRQNPATNAPKIDVAHDGDTFEFVSVDSGWYGVKLDDGSIGFISAKYIIAGETNN